MNDSAYALPAGYRLSDYCFDEFIDRVGFGLVYAATDTALQAAVSSRNT